MYERGPINDEKAFRGRATFRVETFADISSSLHILTEERAYEWKMEAMEWNQLRHL